MQYSCIEKASLDKSNLFEHVGTHTEEISHQCTICGKCFSCESNLNYHVKTRTGQKPLQCGKNERPFIDKSMLRRY